MSPCKPAAITVLTALMALPAHAYEPGTSRAANTLAMGFTGLAAPSDNAGITMNPSMLALRDRYDFDAQFGYAHPHVGWGLSVVDSRTTKAGFGFGYRRLAASPPFLDDELPGWAPIRSLPTNLKRFHEMTFATAIPALRRRISFGANGTLSVFNHDRQGRGTSGNVDAGVGAEPVDGLIIGIVGHELIPDAGEFEHPFGLGAGIRLESETIGALEVNGDYFLEEARNGPFQVSAGGEKVLAEARLRAGWAFREDRQWITAGMGAQNEAGAVEYGLAIPTDMERAGDITHMISVRILAPRQ